VRLRKDINDAAELALTAARDRILTLEDELSRAMGTIRRQQEVDDARVTAAAEADKEAAAQRERDASAWRREREQLETDAVRRQTALESLEQENGKMQEHLQMLTEKMALLDEQLRLAMDEISLVTAARDDAKRSLEATQAHLEAIKSEMRTEAESRAQVRRAGPAWVPQQYAGRARGPDEAPAW
jgi:chromosome segregation ATPase